MTIVLAGIAGLAAVALLLLTVWRPVLGCAALVLLVPLTAGLARGAVIPVLKPSEAILLVVVAGVVAHQVAARPRQPLSGLDIVLGAYVIGSVGIPWIVLFLTRYPATLDTWRTVLSPALFLAVYYAFSRTRLREGDFRTIINCALVGGVLVSIIAAAELANLPLARSVFTSFYTGPADTPFRPSATLGHYSAVGGLGLLTYIIALTLATMRTPGFPTWWLMFVMAASLLGIIASETWAPLVALPIATGIVLLYGRHIPRPLVVAAVAGVLAAIILWPLISTRVDSQQLITSQGISLPESMQTRVRYWNEFIIPALSDHLLVGTGTVIPSTVPDKLTAFVDNEYLWAGFRAGVPGIALLVGMLLATIVVGWGQRLHADPSRRAIGGAAVATAIMLLILGVTAQYITFAGLTQEIAMLFGVLGALTTATFARRSRAVVIQAPPQPRWIAVPRSLEGAVVELRQFKPDVGLLRSSAVVFIGFTAARALGFLFSVAAARILAPHDFGQLTYAIAVLTVTSMFISSSPTGLARFLSRNHADRELQASYFGSWVTVVTLIAVATSVFIAPAALLFGLSGGLVVGLVCNFIGIAVLETYREIQRGLDRYASMMSVYVIANLTQLIGVLALASLGVRSASLYFVVYGLSSLLALAVMQLAAPITLTFARTHIDLARIKEILRFIRPVLAESVFFAVWFGSDMIMVQHFMSSSATANYAVAKALVNVLVLAPTAIGTTILPKVARLRDESVPRYVLTAVGLTAGATVPLVAGTALIGPWLLQLIFSGKYPDASAPLTILAVGMGLYGFYTVMGSIWVGLGRPIIDSIATCVAMICTLATGIALIPHLGLAGAAWAFTCGAAARLTVIGVYTILKFAGRPSSESREAASKIVGLQTGPLV